MGGPRITHVAETLICGHILHITRACAPNGHKKHFPMTKINIFKGEDIFEGYGKVRLRLMF